MVKKLMVYMLSVLLLTNLLTSSVVEASTINSNIMIESNQDLSAKTNYNFISISDPSNIVYTYEQDGSIYLVHESFNAEFTAFSTEIFIADGETSKLIEEYTTNIELSQNSITFTK